MEQGKSYHMHLSLRGALNWPKPQFKTGAQMNVDTYTRQMNNRAGLKPVAASKVFTTCCKTAICDDQQKCPSCGNDVYPFNERMTDKERHVPARRGNGDIDR